MKQFLITAIWFGMSVASVLAQDGSITARHVSKIPMRDPYSPVWDKAAFAPIAILPQNIIPPILAEGTIPSLSVRAIHDQEYIAFQLEWPDKSRNAVVDVNLFSDQVAIQLPLDPVTLPAVMMGNAGGKVQIIHWKAIWQDDIEKGYRDVSVLHPNYWADMYFFVDEPIFAEGEFARSLQAKHFTSSEARNYMPGVYSRNPVSSLDRKAPVEEIEAEGFGTATTQRKQNADGWGSWKNGKWRVMIVRPLVSEDPDDAPLPNETSMAFAVWDGSAGNVGSRKHYSSAWSKLKLDRP